MVSSRHRNVDYFIALTFITKVFKTKFFLLDYYYYYLFFIYGICIFFWRGGGGGKMPRLLDTVIPALYIELVFILLCFL